MFSGPGIDPLAGMVTLVMDRTSTFASDHHRASARRYCAVYLRMAARIAARTPHLPSFVIDLHARVLSRDLWRGEIVESNLDTIQAMSALISDSESKLRIALGQATWCAHIALGREPYAHLRPKPRRRPGGEVKTIEDYFFEVHHTERRWNRLVAERAGAEPVRICHERLLNLTKLGRTLPIQTSGDAATLLEDLHSRGKQYASMAARRLRVQCRDLSRRLYASSVQSGMTLQLASLLSVAQQLDAEAHSDLHHDVSKVIAWLDKEEGQLSSFRQSWRNQYKGHSGPLARAAADEAERLARLETLTLGGQTINREQLYEMVWTDAVTVVAKRSGISDVALRKLCLRRSVPLPPVGYWAHIRRKGKSGKGFSKPALPQLA